MVEIRACALGTLGVQKAVGSFQWPESHVEQSTDNGEVVRSSMVRGRARILGSVPIFGVSNLCLVPVEDWRVWSTVSCSTTTWLLSLAQQPHIPVFH